MSDDGKFEPMSDYQGDPLDGSIVDHTPVWRRALGVAAMPFIFVWWLARGCPRFDR